MFSLLQVDESEDTSRSSCSTLVLSPNGATGGAEGSTWQETGAEAGPSRHLHRLAEAPQSLDYLNLEQKFASLDGASASHARPRITRYNR